MLKALTGLLIAGAAALAIASPASAAVVCTDGEATNISQQYPPPYWHIVYFDAADYCTADGPLEIVSIDWSSSWHSGSSGGMDGISGPENILVTVWDGTDYDDFYLAINP